jgi:hypothetical protein
MAAATNSITAKVRIEGIEPIPYDENQTQLVFVADYENDANQEWARYTPSLRLTMTVKKAVAEQFKPEGRYTLTFTEDSVKETKANG